MYEILDGRHIAVEERRAITTHLCDFCSDPILPGETYHRVFKECEGTLIVEKSHKLTLIGRECDG